jgi:hypothetical protein
MTVLPSALRRPPLIRPALGHAGEKAARRDEVAAAHFTIQKERRSVDYFGGLDVSVKGSSICMLTTAASSRPHSSLLQKGGFVSKI